VVVVRVGVHRQRHGVQIRDEARLVQSEDLGPGPGGTVELAASSGGRGAYLRKQGFKTCLMTWHA